MPCDCARSDPAPAASITPALGPAQGASTDAGRLLQPHRPIARLPDQRGGWNQGVAGRRPGLTFHLQPGRAVDVSAPGLQAH